MTRLSLRQPARGEGYRVNVDALHLAAFARPVRGTLVDLGAGVGAVGLSIALRLLPRRLLLIEIDRAAAVIAQENAALNGLSDRVTVVPLDVLEAARAHVGVATLVVSNPPYFEPGTGRAARAAPQARMGELVHFVEAARLLLGRRGRVCFVYPARDVVRLVGTLREAGLEPKRMQFVHAKRDRPARICLVEATPGKPGGLVTEPPLFENDARAEARSAT